MAYLPHILVISVILTLFFFGSAISKIIEAVFVLLEADENERKSAIIQARKNKDIARNYLLFATFFAVFLMMIIASYILPFF